ncbi:MAG: RloB domain-containing protein [Polyangia bacterium]
MWCAKGRSPSRSTEALELAKKSRVQVALSNPCIELWALLHFQDQNERIHRHEAQHALKAFMPKYDKALDFPKMIPKALSTRRFGSSTPRRRWPG